MERYSLEVFIENSLIFYMEFKSITSLCKCIDRFINVDKFNIWFEVTDNIKDISINVKELMAIWHS